MKLRTRYSTGAPCGGESGFTMAEIAIALGVIAIALIAILGVLPTGLQVQRDNREETIINQDARLLLQALKTAGREDLAPSDLGSFVVITNDKFNAPFNVTGIPNFVVMRDGKVVFQQAGMVRQPQMEKWLREAGSQE